MVGALREEINEMQQSNISRQQRDNERIKALTRYDDKPDRVSCSS